MKEQHYFYTPEPQSLTLPDEEAQHASRVLRLQAGDEIFLMDGRGNFYNATITESTKKACRYDIIATMPQSPEWPYHIHLAMAPTKNMDRTEWMAEKATEIGMDELTLLNCQWSERRIVKRERIERILVSAMKQSRKAWLPLLNDMTDFTDFIATPRSGQKFICHCHSDNLPLLKDQLSHEGDALVMIGPEGDFSPAEVAAAEAAGFMSVSLGTSRLRTETAAIVATVMMRNK